MIDGIEIGAPPEEALARRLATNSSVTLEEDGAEEDMGAPYAARLMRLNFLAPDIVAAILNDRQPAALSDQTDSRHPAAARLD